MRNPEWTILDLWCSGLKRAAAHMLPPSCYYLVAGAEGAFVQTSFAMTLPARFSRRIICV